MAVDARTQEKIRKYVLRARQTLETGKLVMAHEDYIAAVNRAYYAIFYAANALLATKGLERSKHSGVIAAFRSTLSKQVSSNQSSAVSMAQQWMKDTRLTMNSSHLTTIVPGVI